MAKKNWVKSVAAGIKKRGTEGVFTKKAHAAGMGVQEYAAHVTKEGSTASAKTKKQAGLAKAFAGMKHKKKK